jgi:hypothetical protein
MHSQKLWHSLWVLQSFDLMMPADTSLYTSSSNGQHDPSSQGGGMGGVVALVVVASSEI